MIGGDEHIFAYLPLDYVKTSLLGATTPEMQLFLLELTIGLLGTTRQENCRVGGYKNRVYGAQSVSVNIGGCHRPGRLSDPQPCVRCDSKGTRLEFTKEVVCKVKNCTNCLEENSALFRGGSGETSQPSRERGQVSTTRGSTEPLFSIYYVSMPRRNSRQEPNTGGDRLEQISRFFTRIARHGQKPTDGPLLEFNPRREAYIQHITEHPSFQALYTTEEDFRQIANDIGEADKRRIYVRWEENI